MYLSNVLSHHFWPQLMKDAEVLAKARRSING
jgi:hypothetical protein